MYDLLISPGVKGLKVVPKIFKKQSHEIRSVPPAVFFESCFEISRQFLEKHS